MQSHIYTDPDPLCTALKTLAGDKALPAFCACVDARHLACPMPLLKAKLALRQSDAVYVVASDPHSADDLGAFCQKNHLSLQHWRDDWLHFVVQKR